LAGGDGVNRLIELGPSLDALWAQYANDDAALDARESFPDWVRRKTLEERRSEDGSGSATTSRADR